MDRPAARLGRGPQASAWMFLAPSAVVLVAVMVFPLGYAIYLSLFNYAYRQPEFSSLSG